MNIETVLESYIVCALWSSTDDKDHPLGDNYGPEDIAPETIKSMQNDVEDFLNANKESLEQSGLSDWQIGIDFWLSRCGHGSGFFDRGLGSLGGKLQAIAKVYGSVDLYVGDDGMIYSN